jgi:hypothetical protein
MDCLCSVEPHVQLIWIIELATFFAGKDALAELMELVAGNIDHSHLAPWASPGIQPIGP